eukprot:SAG22_NODE_2043_length_3090_cov_2.470077_3_plen_143_part_00
MTAADQLYDQDDLIFETDYKRQQAQTALTKKRKEREVVEEEYNAFMRSRMEVEKPLKLIRGLRGEQEEQPSELRGEQEEQPSESRNKKAAALSRPQEEQQEEQPARKRSRVASAALSQQRSLAGAAKISTAAVEFTGSASSE